MKEFIKVADFEYKSVPYTMFIDNKDRYFFMKRKDGEYYYTTFEEQKELLGVFYNVRNVMNIETGDKVNFVPKIITGALITTMAFNMFAGVVKAESIKIVDSNTKEEITIETPGYYEEKFYVAEDKITYNDYFEEDTIMEFPGAGSRVNIHDSAYLNSIFGSEQPTLDMLYKVIDNNHQIPEKYKQLFRDYCFNLVSFIPKADRRILYHNLQTLSIKEVDRLGMIIETFSMDSCACYYPRDNVITLYKDYEFNKGTWEYQVLFHELSHAARIAYFSKNGKNYEIKSGGFNFENVMVDETLNTLFSIKCLGYPETDFAYQLQSNYMDIITESMDNYDISDYINHSQSYFIMRLDEYAGKGDKARAMMELMTMQYDDYHNEFIHIEQSEFYPFYDYVADIFYKNKIVPGMSYEAALSFKEELIRRITFDIPKEYEIDINHFDEHFDNYCREMGIEVPNKSL